MAYLSGYTKRIPITIDNTNVDATLTDFPLLVKFTNNTIVGANIDSNGYNIRFTSSDGETLLKYERESFTYGGGSSSGVFWVKVPSVAGAVDTTIYMYYKVGSASDGQDATNVWDSNYKGVWHLNEASGGSTAVDSTSYVHNLAVNTNGDMPSAAGVISNSRDFEESDGYYDGLYKESNANLETGTSFHVSCYVNIESYGHYNTLMSKDDVGGTNKREWNLVTDVANSDKLGFGILNGTGGSLSLYASVYWGTALSTGTWYRVDAWHDASAKTVSISVNNGTPVTSSPYVGTHVSTSAYFGLGCLFNFNVPHISLDGKLDEARFSKTVRSAEWRKFEYYNINESDNELSFGAEESPQYLSGYTKRKAITIDNTYVDSDLTDFPLLVKINADTDIAQNIDSNGYNIRFTSSDGTTLLKYERQSFTYGSGSATGIFWVKVPTVLGSRDTTIYVYFKEDSPSDGADPTNVWDSNFKAVYHLEAAGNTTQEDSTSNNRDLSPTNMESGDSITGKIGSAIELGGTNEVLAGGAWTEFRTTDQSLSLWYNPSSTPASHHTLFQATDNAGEGWAINANQRYDTGAPEAGSIAYYYRNNSTWLSGGQRSAISVGNWYHLVVRLANNIFTVRINGSEVYNSNPGTLNPTSSAVTNVGIGAYWAGSWSGNFTVGKHDEVRFSNSSRSNAWFKFEYYNMGESDNELSFGPLESSSYSPYTCLGLTATPTPWLDFDYYVAAVARTVGILTQLMPLGVSGQRYSDFERAAGVVSVALKIVAEHLLNIEASKSSYLEHLINTGVSPNVCLEHLLSTGNINKNLTLEHLLDISSNYNVVIDHLLDLSMNKNVVIEHILSLAATERSISLEHLLGVAGEKNIVLETLQNLSMDKKAYLEHLLQMQDSTNGVVLEHLLGVGIDYTQLVEHLLSTQVSTSLLLEHLFSTGNISTAQLIEHLVDVTENKSVLLEHLLASGSDNKQVIEHLLNVSGEMDLVLEHLLNSGNILHSQLLEHLITLDSSLDIVIEHLADSVLSVDVNIYLEHLLTIGISKNAILEHLISIDAILHQEVIEHLLSMSATKIYDIEHLISLGVSKDYLVEHLMNLSAETGALLEHVLGVASSKNVYLEYLSGLGVSKNQLVEHLISVGVSQDLVMEHLISEVVTIDSVLVLETLLGVDSTHDIYLEHLVNISEGVSVPVEHLSGLTEAKAIKLEHLVGVEGANTLVVDWLTGISKQGVLYTEWTRLLGVQNSVLVEFLLQSETVNKAVLLEHLLGLDADLIIPIEIIPFGADTSKLIEWILFERGTIWVLPERGRAYTIPERGTIWTLPAKSDSGEPDTTFTIQSRGSTWTITETP